MAYVEPIKTRKQLHYAARYLTEHHDPAFELVWQIGIESGLRISDILKLTYNNIDLSTGQCEVVESKGALARQARAKYKVLKQVKEELILYYHAKGKSDKVSALYITTPHHVMGFLPSAWKDMVALRLKQAISAVPKVIRRFHLSPALLKRIKQRKADYQGVDDNALFSRRTLLSNRAKGQDGLLTRQACWRVFSKLGGVLKAIGVTVKVGCHSLRKSFARHLYFSTGKNIGLLMTMIGHQSEKMSLHYIGLSDDETERAQKKLVKYLSAA